MILPIMALGNKVLKLKAKEIKNDHKILQIFEMIKYIVENKLLRREGDARTVETRFDFPDYYIIVNKQSYVYPNHHVGKTLLILPKSRYINGFTKYNVWETAINYYHKYINELYTNDNSYPLEVLKKKVFLIHLQI